MGFIETLISQLAPHVCVGCGQEGSLLCKDCTPGLSFITCQASGHLRHVTAVATYETIAKDLVWQLKFQGAQAAAGAMAERMASQLRSAYSQQCIIVPAPTAARRARQRGYDQAKLLARQLAKHAGLAYTDCLQRRGQAHQVGSSRQQRLKQLQTAFRLKSRYDVRDCSVLLVDDVLTTGATLEAAASVLKEAGARYVDAIVFARTE
jgi:ComF family protein